MVAVDDGCGSSGGWLAKWFLFPFLGVRVTGGADVLEWWATFLTCAEVPLPSISRSSLNRAGPEKLAVCVIRGRRITPTEVKTVQELLLEKPCLGRWSLALELCQLWQWRAAHGGWNVGANRNSPVRAYEDSPTWRDGWVVDFFFQGVAGDSKSFWQLVEAQSKRPLPHLDSGELFLVGQGLLQLHQCP